MLNSRLDTALLDSLVEMGGEELRLQLLADLRDSEAALKAICASDQGSTTSIASDAARVLHTLRGLAMTIGADALAKACMRAEELDVLAGRDALVQHITAVIEECALVHAQIEKCPDINA